MNSHIIPNLTVLQCIERKRWQEIEKLNAEVQTFIRTQPGFDSSQPKKYQCSIESIQCACNPDAWKDITFNELINSFEHDNHYLLRKKNKVSVIDLTPFQGERVFGEYSCRCRRAWMSAGSWKNMFQKCKHCERKVYPHSQSKLKKRDDDEEEVERCKRPHDTARCQKCVIKGSLYMPTFYYEI